MSHAMTEKSWLTRLHSARTPSERTETLKSLKNLITGHPLVKEAVVTQGILDPIVKLASNQSAPSQDDKVPNHSLDDEDQSRLQALKILASVALEGPRLLAPLLSAGALPALLTNVSPASNSPQLVLASLRLLSNIIDSSALISSPRNFSIYAIAEAVFVRPHLDSLRLILSQTSASSSTQSQISITASLISRICREERHQLNLTKFGILDALATRLASFIVDFGLILPGFKSYARKELFEEFIPEPAPPKADFAGVLEAISVIITNSKLRCSHLIHSPSILAILSVSQSTEFIANHFQQATLNCFNLPDKSFHRPQLYWLDHLLPHIPQEQCKTLTAFPPLGTTISEEDVKLKRRSSVNKSKSPSSLTELVEDQESECDLSQSESKGDPEDLESPLISCLMILIRMKSGLDRLLASAILANLYRAGLTHKRREIEIGFLIVPLLVHMLDKSRVLGTKKKVLEQEENEKLNRATKEMAPAILAMFMTDSEYLQKSAFEAGVITQLSILLKSAYEPVLQTATTLPWSPDMGDEMNYTNSARLWPISQSPLLAHKIRVRESVLKAIAALVPFEEEYRKSIVDQGLMCYIIESMSIHPKKPSVRSSDKPAEVVSGLDDGSTDSQYGENPIPVLIAACGAVRALSRSVCILRTTMIDYGVAQPVFRLLQHPEIEAQVAATATVINLLTDVSPLRDTISKAGVLKILCGHAKSRYGKLRLNAVWALKHFIQGVNNEMKQKCLEELGHSWLIQLICDDIEYGVLSSSRDKIEKTQEPSETSDDDIEMDQSEDHIDTSFGGPEVRSKSKEDVSGNGSLAIQKAQLKLSALRDAELDPIGRARRDDIAVQEQALDFIRNLIGGVGKGTSGSEAPEMIDFLFSIFGQDRIFEILISKLRPKAINPYNRKYAGSGESKVIPAPAEIIIAVAYILVHMAASVPRHRQLIVTQTELLKLLVPLFHHSNLEVRLALCWLVSNLLWMDDQTDANSCSHRAGELRKLGFLTKIEMLEYDPELSVRERAKSALWQMQQTY